MNEQEGRKVDAEIANINALSAKYIAEVTKLSVEVTKLSSESKYYPIILGSSVTLAIVAIVKLFL